MCKFRGRVTSERTPERRVSVIVEEDGTAVSWIDSGGCLATEWNVDRGGVQ